MEGGRCVKSVHSLCTHLMEILYITHKLVARYSVEGLGSKSTKPVKCPVYRALIVRLWNTLVFDETKMTHCHSVHTVRDGVIVHLCTLMTVPLINH